MRGVASQRFEKRFEMLGLDRHDAELEALMVDDQPTPFEAAMAEARELAKQGVTCALCGQWVMKGDEDAEAAKDEYLVHASCLLVETERLADLEADLIASGRL